MIVVLRKAYIFVPEKILVKTSLFKATGAGETGAAIPQFDFHISYSLLIYRSFYSGTNSVTQLKKLQTMSDNKNITSQQDRIQIDVNDPSEVEYVHSLFPELEHEQIVEAIKEKGPLRKTVMEYIKTKYRV
jgi:hypothetical protein